MTRRLSARASLLAILPLLGLLLPIGPAALRGRPDDRQLGRLRRRHDRHLDAVRRPHPVVRRRRRRGPGAEHPPCPGLRRHPVADRHPPARHRVHPVDARPAARRHRRLDRGQARRQAQLHVGRQRHDRRRRLDHDQRHVHAARRGSTRRRCQVYIGTGRTGRRGRVHHLVDDILITAPAADRPDGDVLETDFESRPRRLGPARRRAGQPDRRRDRRDEAHSPTHAALVSDRTSQGDGIGHDVTGIMNPGSPTWSPRG